MKINFSDIECFAIKCIGKSHIDSDKPCQDSVYFIKEPEHLAVSAADGHGSDSYFRSDTGSKIAAETACKKIMEFLKTYSDICDASDEDDKSDKFIRQLIESIVVEWKKIVKEHILADPFSDTEMEKVPESLVHIYEPFSDKKREEKSVYELEQMLKPESDPGLLKAYGTTLITVGICENYMIALHIGDGKLVAIYEDGKIDEPVPWDEKCHLNVCTSICDEKSMDEFRFYVWKDEMPIAVFAGSDGIDDSYADMLHQFYLNLTIKIAENGLKNTVSELKQALPKISEMGSNDDMSVVAIVDEARIAEQKANLSEIIRKMNNEVKIRNINIKIDELKFRCSNITRLMEKCDDLSEKKSEYCIKLADIEKEIESLETEKRNLTSDGEEMQ